MDSETNSCKNENPGPIRFYGGERIAAGPPFVESKALIFLLGVHAMVRIGFRLFLFWRENLRFTTQMGSLRGLGMNGLHA